MRPGEPRRLPLADGPAAGPVAPQRAVLVGPVQQENLALQYLAASARAAGHAAEVIAYSYRSDLDAAVRAVLERKPDLVGLGIAFQNNIDDYLAFVREVRRRGFAHNESAIAHCREAGITPSFNFMLFDPDCSIEDIDATLDMADRNLDLPWNVCRTEVYSGTRLRERLEEEGRLEGDYRSYGYRMRDPRAEVMFRIVRVCMHDRALAIESLLNRLISLSFARQLHEHFFPGAATDRIAAAIRDLSVAVRRDTVLVLRELAAFVRSEDIRDKDRVRRYAVALAVAVNARDLPLHNETERLWRHLNTRGRLLSARRWMTVPLAVRGGWGVAAGS
jgi:hypothetical protein